MTTHSARSATCWTEYSYDANGNVTKVVLPGGGIITYTYDNDDRVISETHEEKDGDISNRICYTYDHAGNLTSQTDAEGNTTAYGYDLMDREVSWTGPDGGVMKRSYVYFVKCFSKKSEVCYNGK